jgi:uncharacterized protein YeaO (DUF488 family)
LPGKPGLPAFGGLPQPALNRGTLATAMAVHIVRLGSPRQRGEGTRIGTVRRPPRGVAKQDFARGDWYDVWFPALSPSQDLVKRALATQRDRSPASARAWSAFVRAYRKQMAAPDAVHAITLLAALSLHAQFSVGCYCADESRCHRSVLRDLLGEAGAKIK